MTMQLFLFASTLATLATVGNSYTFSNLRSQKPAVAESAPNFASVESHVILHGVLEEASANDIEMIGNALVATYNDINWESGYSMSNSVVKVPYKVAIPEAIGGQGLKDRSTGKGSKGLYLTVVTPINVKQCGHCGDDELSMRFVPLTVKQCGHCGDDELSMHYDADDFSAREEFVASFCEKIKSSASANLASANRCSVTLVVQEAEADASVEQRRSTDRTEVDMYGNMIMGMDMSCTDDSMCTESAPLLQMTNMPAFGDALCDLLVLTGAAVFEEVSDCAIILSPHDDNKMDEEQQEDASSLAKKKKKKTTSLGMTATIHNLSGPVDAQHLAPILEDALVRAWNQVHSDDPNHALSFHESQIDTSPEDNNVDAAANVSEASA
jgi:hypothetical protein